MCATAKKKATGPKTVMRSASSVGAKLCCICDRYGAVRIAAKINHATDTTPAAMNSGCADGTRVDCRICPTDFQSSLAGCPGSTSDAPSAMNISSFTCTTGSRAGRRASSGGSSISAAGLRISSRAGGGADATGGAAGREVVISASRTLSASWIAAIAASVGSTTFFGVFDIVSRLTTLQTDKPRHPEPSTRENRIFPPVAGIAKRLPLRGILTARRTE